MPEWSGRVNLAVARILTACSCLHFSWKLALSWSLNHHLSAILACWHVVTSAVPTFLNILIDPTPWMKWIFDHNWLTKIFCDFIHLICFNLLPVSKNSIQIFRVVDLEQTHFSITPWPKFSPMRSNPEPKKTMLDRETSSCVKQQPPAYPVSV